MPWKTQGAPIKRHPSRGKISSVREKRLFPAITLPPTVTCTSTFAIASCPSVSALDCTSHPSGSRPAVGQLAPSALRRTRKSSVPCLAQVVISGLWLFASRFAAHGMGSQDADNFPQNAKTKHIGQPESVMGVIAMLEPLVALDGRWVGQVKLVAFVHAIIGNSPPQTVAAHRVVSPIETDRRRRRRRRH